MARNFGGGLIFLLSPPVTCFWNCVGQHTHMHTLYPRGALYFIQLFDCLAACLGKGVRIPIYITASFWGDELDQSISGTTLTRLVCLLDETFSTFP